jgi:nucleotide-binding universal stress UspA family protein
MAAVKERAMHDILAFADNYRYWNRSLRYAAELAALFEANLTGVFVCEPVMAISPSPLPVLPPELYTVGEDIAREARAAAPSFDAFVHRFGAGNSRWLVARGHIGAALSASASWHDLLVLGARGESPWTSATGLGELLLSCELPCIVVPETLRRKATVRNVVIAWNGSVEAIRAVHAALPILKRARRVVLLAGEQKDTFSTIGWNVPFSIEAYLAGHGIDFAKKPFRADARAAGERLAHAADANGADLLVMGAYGRTRFSEWMLGGATRYLLENAPLPLFMRH